MRTDIRNLTIEEYLSSFGGERRVNNKYIILQSLYLDRKKTNIMKKYFFLIGMTLLIVSVILSNIFNENTITNRAIESFFYLPIAYSFVKAFCSKENWLNLLLVSALICSIIIFTPKWGEWTCLVINIACCLFSYIILLLAIKIAKYFDLYG